MIKIEKKENRPLSGREEIYAVSDDVVTPSMVKVKDELSNLLKKDKELIIVKKIESRFGIQEARITAYAYDSPDALNKFEPKKKDKKTAEKTG